MGGEQGLLGVQGRAVSVWARAVGGELGLLGVQGGAVGVLGEAVALAVLHPLLLPELVVQLLLHPPLHLVLLLLSLAPGTGL